MAVLVASLVLGLGLAWHLVQNSTSAPDGDPQATANSGSATDQPVPTVPIQEQTSRATHQPNLVFRRHNSPDKAPAFPPSVASPENRTAALAGTPMASGATDAAAVLVGTLRASSDPAQIELLARTLEQAAPGKFRQEALTAAREALDRIARGEVTNKDAGPLFEVLRDYGDQEVVAELTSRVPQWQYYATMALAQLPAGGGIPALVQQLDRSIPEAPDARNFTLQMLAQIAGQYPEAASALLDQARSQLIPERAWRRIASGLAGDQYQFGIDSLEGKPLEAKTYHIEHGNQNFYSLPMMADSQVGQRIAVIDQLLSVNSNPSAMQTLQDARAALLARVTN